MYMNTRRLVGPELTLKHKSEQNIICVDAPISDPRREMQRIHNIHTCAVYDGIIFLTTMLYTYSSA